MHAALSPGNQYLRFFSPSPRNEPGPGRVALLAWLSDRLVGVASYELAPGPGVAEVAFAVPDDMHGRGIATLLLEHLVSAVRERGVRAFTATALPENRPMLGFFADAGLPVHRKLAGGCPRWPSSNWRSPPAPVGARAGDAQVRVSPARSRDPFLRQLR